jgi:uncharacterized damage-inducible protein DinB
MNSFVQLFERDLDKLIDELNNFKKEKSLWIVAGEINNSAGNLTLHLIGNLNHFIGSVIGKSGYRRERDQEFSDKYIPKTELLDMVRDTKGVIKESLSRIGDTKLHKQYPIDVFGKEMTYEYFLIHLVGHLNYHLGQINYLRRILQL